METKNTEQERYEQAQDFWNEFFRKRGFPADFLDKKEGGE